MMNNTVDKKANSTSPPTPVAKTDQDQPELKPADPTMTVKPAGEAADNLGTATTRVVSPIDPTLAAVAPTGERPAVLPPNTVAIYLPGQAKPVLFKDKEEILLGRAEMSSLPAQDTEFMADRGFIFGVSRKHAVIKRSNEGYSLQDLFSTNGTWLNGKVLVPGQLYPLNNGDQVRLGQFLLFIYLSTDTEKTVDTIQLMDQKKQIQMGLTIAILSERVIPYLRAIADTQRILDEAKNQPSQVNIQSISLHKDGKGVTISAQGASSAIEVVSKKLSPPQINGETKPTAATLSLAEDILKGAAPVLAEDKRHNLATQLLPCLEFLVKSDFQVSI